MFWESDELTAYINEACREIARRSETLKKWKSYKVEAGREAYPFPEDMFRIYRVEYRRSSDSAQVLEYQPFQSMDDIWFRSRGTTGGDPIYWTEWSYPGAADNGLYIYPIPSDTISDGLRVMYYALPRLMISEDDIAEIPAGWEDLAVLFVEYKARRKEAQDNRWQEAYELFETRLKEMLKTTQHWTDQQTYFAGPSASWWGDGEWD